ncbi:hypothetical protein ACVILL_005989 [Bradyrhizobium sp. USDA 3364]
MVNEVIAAAGNTAVPAYLTLLKLGYTVDRAGKGDQEHWIAKKETLHLVADCPLELLGLCLLRSEQGPHWQATDLQIDEFMRQFYPTASST